MPTPWEVLVVSSDLEARRTLSNILELQGFDPICSPTIREALAILCRRSVGLVFCDRSLPDGSFKDCLAAMRSIQSGLRVVLTSRQADWDEYLEATRLGAFDAISAPCRPTDVEWMIVQARRDERNRLRQGMPGEEANTSVRQAAGA